MFYHARVLVQTGSSAKPRTEMGFEPDLTYEDLIGKIAVPFLKRDRFFCGGVVIEPKTVKEVRFNSTAQPSSELMPLIRARNAASQIISNPEWDLTWEGTDITRKVLDDASQRIQDKSPNASSKQQHSDRVFLVHGHDLTALDQAEILVRRFGLTPIILREMASGGRTLIEKIEAHSDVGFAIILLTPDELGGKSAAALSPRARQNVIWEWGYLVGKLGRNRVVCIYKTGVELPSDMGGIVTINVGNDLREKTDELRKEFITAGYHLL
jgi:predicted nucleotide-binding protein